MMGQCRLGIMGGTFNPIHIGHLLTAEAVREALALDEILFIPAAVPPHKLGEKIVSAQKRLEMTKLAVSQNPHFRVSDMELRRTGPSYTDDTIDELHRMRKGLEIYFITGADAINALDTWHNARALLEKCHFVAATRQGTSLRMDALEAFFGASAKLHIHKIVTPELEISSTEIRRRVQAGLSIRYMVPEKVAEYIEKEGLYQ